MFGYPVYVLDPKLQDGKKVLKWDSRAQQGIFVGFSLDHSTLVPLVLNPCSQHISPQYHVIFDDDFTTAPAISSELFRNQEFKRLFVTSREGYLVPLHTKTAEDLEVVIPGRPSPLLSNDWLLHEDLIAHRALAHLHADSDLPVS